mmetsp:Transcript_32549/g.66307  ORF Transcript_32549/g.66307 Transcript_32549/m.66307 type:complete len:612 (+) Transcript_32549:312-2147(+)
MADHHQHHSYLRHGSRLLTLFGDDNLNDTGGGMTISNAISHNTTNDLLLTQHDKLSSESAPWSTRKTILFAEAIVVTAIVIPLVFCFLYHRASKSGHLPTRSASSAPQQHGANNANAATAEVMTSDRALRILQQQHPEDIEPEQEEDDDQSPRTLVQRLTSLPSTILSILLYPFHAIDAGVHSWSTTNADITFLRGVMERLEEERVLQLEDVEERGERLKLAFSKGDSVWEIAEEHFIPPPASYALSPSSPDMIARYIDGEQAATSANEIKEALEEEEDVEERALGEGKLNEEELKQVDNSDDDALDTANDDITAATDDKKDEESDKDKEEEIEGENKNIEEEGSEQNPQLSSLMMDETNIEQVRSVSPLMIDEGEEFVGESLVNSTSATTLFSAGLSPSTPPRSSSPLDTDTGEAPAFLYLPHRKSRSRTNTNETNTTTNMTYSSSHSQTISLESMASSSSHTNNSTQMENSADSNNATSFEEEEELKSVPNNCAICLSEYVSGDTIVTSCDPMCPHAFHQECIVEWLVKMQVGAPCPCCRRTFVQLSPSRQPAAATTTNGTAADGTNNSVRSAIVSPEEEQRRREELRRSIQLGIRRGRAFDFSVISLR